MRRDLGVNALTQHTENTILDTAAGACCAAVMEDESLLVTNLYNRKIRKISEGKAEMYTGSDTVRDANGKPQGGYRDGSLTDNQFGAPWGIAPYGDGWAVSGADNNALRFVTGQRVETISKDFSRPSGLAADGAGDLRLVDPAGLAVRGETLFVCDSFARTILEYTID